MHHLAFNAIPDSENDKANIIHLEIIEGTNIGDVYEINAQGLIGGLGRGRKDGQVLIGSKEYDDDMDEPYNDIVLNHQENNEIGERHFLIKYNRETTGYYLRDLGDGNGTFVRLDTPLLLKTGYIISFGDSHMFIQIYDDIKEDVSKLQIRFLDGPKTEQTFTYSENHGKI
jgi:pSer/pThr/pTyr-binding forkhead associated (FHA) protein